MDQLHDETDESHDAETNSCGDGDFLELFAVGLCAALDQSQRVLGEGASGFAELDNLIHFSGFWKI